MNKTATNQPHSSDQVWQLVTSWSLDGHQLVTPTDTVDKILCNVDILAANPCLPKTPVSHFGKRFKDWKILDCVMEIRYSKGVVVISRERQGDPMNSKIKFIRAELEDLGWPKNDPVHEYVFERAEAAADVLTKRELAVMIADLVDLYAAEHGGH